MLPCPPAEFRRRWPGVLQPVDLPEGRPLLPPDCRGALVEFGLPRTVTVRCYNDITLRFTGTAAPLEEIWSRDLKQGYRLGEMPPDWNRFWHLAEVEYLQGGGWVAMEEPLGRLVVIDLDRREPIYLLNSTVFSFYATLAHLVDWSERTGGHPGAISSLRDGLLRKACVPVEELEPFWMNVIEATLDGDPVPLVVELGPARGD